MVSETQIVKGVLSLLLLGLLTHEEGYGYAVVLRLRGLGLVAMNEGTVYPALTRLEAQGHLSSRLVASTSGPARKYYAVTASGTGELDRLRSIWATVHAAVEGATAITDGPLERSQT